MPESGLVSRLNTGHSHGRVRHVPRGGGEDGHRQDRLDVLDIDNRQSPSGLLDNLGVSDEHVLSFDINSSDAVHVQNDIRLVLYDMLANTLTQSH
jgi:hypothetical protein